MSEPTAFETDAAFAARVGDAAFWRPVIERILRDAPGVDAAAEPVAGANATWPTFVCGDAVVKLFGHRSTAAIAFAAERGALEAVADDPAIAAPRVLAAGQSFDGWHHLVITRMAGEALRPGEATPELAAELGAQVRRVHARPPPAEPTPADWPVVDATAAAARSSLPPHLVAQVEGFLARLGPPDEVLVHADLVAQHVFVQEGRLSGLVDWGDAVVADRHLELIQVFRDALACDRERFRVFLDAAAWPMTDEFATRALQHALRRQALMLAQHPGGDVFEPIAARFPLREIATLDELAEVLFGPD